jgi:hypothetical protein
MNRSAVQNECDETDREGGSGMADEKHDLIGENKRLAEEAKKAILEEIVSQASGAGSRIEMYARAYALVVGAKWGHLPGASAGADG